VPNNGPAERPDAEIGYSRVDVQPDTALLAERFVINVENAARRDRLCVSLSMFAVSGHRPG
jgi:hypothetical protein